MSSFDSESHQSSSISTRFQKQFNEAIASTSSSNNLLQQSNVSSPRKHRSASNNHNSLLNENNYANLGDTTAPSSDALLLALHRSKPNTRLFRALFQYIPLRDSPNENPHLELALAPGDYILVHGQMDEDQFYFGESLNGRTGLVPSNYIERVTDESLLQNAARMPTSNIPSMCDNESNNFAETKSVATQSPPISFRNSFGGFSNNEIMNNENLTKTTMDTCGNLISTESSTAFTKQKDRHSTGSPSFALNIPAHQTQITHDFTESCSNSGEMAQLPDSICPYPPVDVSKVTVSEIKQSEQPRVPFPREINVEKKLSRSCVISWLPPDEQLTTITQYHVCCDGIVKAVVPGIYKCKALIEDLNLDRSVNISIRAISEKGHSPDAACTVAVGAEAPVAPQHVRVTNITPISAQAQIQGLPPSTIFRLSVRTKHPKAVLEKRPVERCCDFKTLPKIGLPDPPLNVQAEIGPQPGTILISWNPVSNQPKPPSKAAVDSYLIFGDGRNIAQVSSANADHILLKLSDFADDLPIFITVRTKTREGILSADSNVVRVPRNSLNNIGFSANSSVLYSLDLASNPQRVMQPPHLANPMIYSTILPATGIFFVAFYLLGSAQISTMPLNVMPSQTQQFCSTNPGGLLTTAPNSSSCCGPQTSEQQQRLYNLAAFGSQAAALLGQQQQELSQMVQQQQTMSLNRPLNVYTSTANALPTNQPQILQQQHSDQPYALNGINYSSSYPSKNSIMFNDIGNTGEWKQAQNPLTNTTQYYTFHPKALYKEYSAPDEKPSVLEMENNYLLKHQQPQLFRHNNQPSNTMLIQGRNSPIIEYGTIRTGSYYVPTANSGQLTGRQRKNLPNHPWPQPTATVMAGDQTVKHSRGSNIMSNTPIAPRLARVRSAELLGTQSEPDLRPVASVSAANAVAACDEENTRWFVALFDYSPHMSPNQNAQQDELFFRKHQLIKVS